MAFAIVLWMEEDLHNYIASQVLHKYIMLENSSRASLGGGRKERETGKTPYPGKIIRRLEVGQVFQLFYM